MAVPGQVVKYLLRPKPPAPQWNTSDWVTSELKIEGVLMHTGLQGSRAECAPGSWGLIRCLHSCCVQPQFSFPLTTLLTFRTLPLPPSSWLWFLPSPDFGSHFTHDWQQGVGHLFTNVLKFPLLLSSALFSPPPFFLFYSLHSFTFLYNSSVLSTSKQSTFIKRNLLIT